MNSFILSKYMLSFPLKSLDYSFQRRFILLLNAFLTISLMIHSCLEALICEFSPCDNIEISLERTSWVYLDLGHCNKEQGKFSFVFYSVGYKWNYTDFSQVNGRWVTLKWYCNILIISKANTVSNQQWT